MSHCSDSSRQNQTSCFVYLIEHEDGQYTKIGISNDPESRLASHQTGNPHLLVLRYLIHCRNDEEAAAIERLLLMVFSSKAAVGEWVEAPASEIIACWRALVDISSFAHKLEIEEMDISIQVRDILDRGSVVRFQKDVIQFLQANPDSVNWPGKAIAEITGASEATVSRARRAFSKNGHLEG